MLSDVVEILECPVCAGALTEGAGVLTCPARHTFDVARQGYVNLLPGGARPGTGDTPAMVAAREDFLSAGHFDPLRTALADLVAELSSGARFVLDAGAGTGRYSAVVLDRSPATRAAALDVSKHALRRAARAHPRIGAVAADLWRRLPVRDGSVDAVLNVFAPRNAGEFHRVLRPGGLLYVVTPTVRHLTPLVRRFGLVTVDERKADRIAAALDGRFARSHTAGLDDTVELSRPEIAALIGMGPSARHLSGEALSAALASLSDRTQVRLSFDLTAFRAVARE